MTAPETLNRMKGLPFFGIGGYYTTGNTFFVDSGHPHANDAPDHVTPDYPMATIDYAIGQCTASNGDIIYVMPGHTEAVIAAGTIACDVAGVSIVGLGNGSNRPTITYTTATAAQLNVSAANVTFDGFLFDMTGIDAVAVGIYVTAAYFTMRNCEVIFADSGGQATLGILTTAAADNMLIEDNRFIGSDDAGTAAAISLVGTDSATIRRNFIKGAFTNSIGGIKATGTANTNIDISQNFIYNTTADSTVCIDLMAGTTGVVRDNELVVLTDTGVGHVDTVGNTVFFRNWIVNQVAETEKATPFGTASV